MIDRARNATARPAMAVGAIAAARRSGWVRAVSTALLAAALTVQPVVVAAGAAGCVACPTCQSGDCSRCRAAWIRPASGQPGPGRQAGPSPCCATSECCSAARPTLAHGHCNDYRAGAAGAAASERIGCAAICLCGQAPVEPTQPPRVERPAQRESAVPAAAAVLVASAGEILPAVSFTCPPAFSTLRHQALLCVWRL